MLVHANLPKVIDIWYYGQSLKSCKFVCIVLISTQQVFIFYISMDGSVYGRVYGSVYSEVYGRVYGRVYGKVDGKMDGSVYRSVDCSLDGKVDYKVDGKVDDAVDCTKIAETTHDWHGRLVRSSHGIGNW